MAGFQRDEDTGEVYYTDTLPHIDRTEYGERSPRRLST
jgi:hypothetical protein